MTVRYTRNMLPQHPPSPPDSQNGERRLSTQSQYTPETRQPANMFASQQEGVQALPFGCVEVDPNIMPTTPDEFPSSDLYANVSDNPYPSISSIPYRSYMESQQLGTLPSSTGAGITNQTGDAAVTLNSTRNAVRRQERRKARVNRSPRVRKHRPRTDKDDGMEITKPLTESTRHMVHIPLKDLQAYVNRSKEERIKEVAKKNKGRIARPMNSFMLYRFTLADRIKELCKHGNHQVISKVAGDGWKLEPEEVRAEYERYATIERENHQRAHPGYKFTPNKNQSTPKKKRNQDDDIEDDGFIDGPAYEGLGYQINIGGIESEAEFRSRHSTPYEHDSTFNSRRATPCEQPGDMYGNSEMNRSSWGMVNPGRPLPGMMSGPEQTHYYQPSIHQSFMGANIQDVTFRRMDLPGMSADTTGTLVSLPGNPHPDLLPVSQPPTTTSGPMFFEQDTKVDPQLLNFEDASVPITTGPMEQEWELMTTAPGYMPGLAAQDDQYASQFRLGTQATMEGQPMFSDAGMEPGPMFNEWVDNPETY